MGRIAGTDALAEAARILQSGGLVVVPTETVYGLAANALDAKAVAAIYQAKGRPQDNPVIVHVVQIAQAKTLCRAWPPEADTLARAFWPGPLTLVLPRASHVPDVVTAGLDTVAIRVPDHPLLLALLELAQLPLAAPSANTSTRPSPTRVGDAVADLGDKVPLYLDGGPCRVGLESTVVDVSAGRPRILRQGGISAAQIEVVVGPLAEAPHSDVPRAPGMKYRHYAPRVPLRILGDGADAMAEARREFARPAFLLSLEHPGAGPGVVRVAARRDGNAWAKALFALLRDLEKTHDAIFIEAIPEEGLGAAVMERVRKAAKS